MDQEVPRSSRGGGTIPPFFAVFPLVAGLWRFSGFNICKCFCRRDSAIGFLNWGVFMRRFRVLVGNCRVNLGAANGIGCIALLFVLLASQARANGNSISTGSVNLWVASGAVVALLAAVLATWYALRQRRFFQALHEAINRSDMSLEIYDSKGVLIFANSDYTERHPRMPVPVSGKTQLRDMIKEASKNGTNGVQLGEKAAARIAEERIKLVAKGGRLTRILRNDHGRDLLRHSSCDEGGRFFAICTDVTALETARRNAMDSVKELRQSNEKLQSFTMTAAHDLKAPLRNVRMLFDWIVEELKEQGQSLPAEATQKLAMIDKLLHRQNKLISDLLSYAHSGQHDSVGTIAPMTLMPDIVQMSAVTENFKLNLPKKMPDIRANSVAFETVMRNLLNNAVKHHDKPQGEITVEARVADTLCIISVADDGPGIAEKHRSRIFEPFFSLTGDEAGRHSGLGLALIAREVRGWGGDISVTQSKGRRGASFTFTVPLAKADKADETHNKKQSQVGRKDAAPRMESDQTTVYYPSSRRSPEAHRRLV